MSSTAYKRSKYIQCLHTYPKKKNIGDIKKKIFPVIYLSFGPIWRLLLTFFHIVTSKKDN